MYIDNNNNIYLSQSEDTWPILGDIPKQKNMWKDGLTNEEDTIKAIQKIIMNGLNASKHYDIYTMAKQLDSDNYDRSVHFEIPHVKSRPIIKSKITRKQKNQNKPIINLEKEIKEHLKEHLKIDFKPMPRYGGFDYSNQMRYAISLYYDKEEIARTTMAINL